MFENFKTHNKQENNIENTESKEKKELLKSSQKLFFIWAFSAIASFTPMKNADAQSTDTTEKPFVPTEQVITPSKEFIEDIEAQKAWLISYIQSPKYLERLSKEYLRLKDVTPETMEDFAESFSKPILDKEGDTLAIINAFDVWAKTIKQNNLDYNLEKIRDINNVFPDVNIKELGEKEKEIVSSNVEARLDLLKTGHYSIVDSLEKTDGEINYGVYHPYNQNIEMMNNLPDSVKETPSHEFTHQSTDGNKLIFKETRFILNRYAKTFSDYLSSPTEIMARLNVLRYLLDKQGIYNPLKENFNEKDYNNLLKNEEINKSLNVKQLLDIFDKDVLIWMMNNIADATNTDKEPVISPLNHDPNFLA